MQKQLKKWINDGRYDEVLLKLMPVSEEASIIQNIWNSVRARYQQNLAGVDEYQDTEKITKEAVIHLVEKYRTALNAHYGITEKPTKPPSIKVFLSYHPADQSTVLLIKQKLENAGADVLLDIEDKLVGETTQGFLDRMMKNKGYILSVISENSLHSVQVGKESFLAAFASYFGVKRFLPVLLDHSLFDDQLVFRIVADLDSKLAEMESNIDQSKQLGLEYDHFEAARKSTKEHRHTLPKIVHQLQQTMLVDASADQFDQAMEKIISAIFGTKK